MRLAFRGRRADRRHGNPGRIITSFLAGVILILVNGGCDKPCAPGDLLCPFKKMASSSDCADIHNRLYKIDQTLVLWERAGRCADAGYRITLFEGSVDRIACDLRDTIAGAMRTNRDPRYGAMFDTILVNLDKPDLGLGSAHVVQKIPF